MLDHNTIKFDIQEIEGYNFDALKIKSEIEDALKTSGLSIMENQINLYHRDESEGIKEKFLDWVGSLSPVKNGTGVLIHESEFKNIHPLLKNSYTHEVIEQIRELSDLPLGRIRWLGLNPKSCYSWHTDPDYIRYHIPLVTSFSSFFVVENGVYRMPDAGKLYSILSTKWHTAVNAHLNTRRVHLVIDTYDPNAANPYDTDLGLTPEEIQRKFDTSRIY